MRLGECVRRSWRTITIGFNIMVQNTPEEEILEMLRTPHIRAINLRNMTFYTYDRQRRQIEVNFFELERQLAELQNEMGRAF